MTTQPKRPTTRPATTKRGPGRPVGEDGPTRVASISLPETLWAKADELQRRRGLPTRSALFAQLLRRAR